MASPTFIGEGYAARRSDTTWGIWQKILGTEIDGNNPFGPGGDDIVINGSNYEFILTNGQWAFALKDGDGLPHVFAVVGNPVQSYLMVDPIEPVVIDPPGPVPALGSNFEFTEDGYMRFKNISLVAPNVWVIASVDDSTAELSVFSSPGPLNTGVPLNQTLNTKFFLDEEHNVRYFGWFDIDSQILYIPELVEESPGVWIIQLFQF